MTIDNNLDFEKAIKRIKKDKRDDPIKDVVGYRDLIKNKQEIIHATQQNLIEYRKYNCGKGQVINIPKPGYTLRPAVLPLFQDRLVYQAIADHLQILHVPEENVYSNKANDENSDYMFISGVLLWLEFQNKIEEYCQDYPYVIETDLTAYFDHVYHKLMKSRINDLFKSKLDKITIDGYNILLGKLWKRWSSPHLNEFGIPQINDPSSFFGNLYLDELDKWLIHTGNPSLRYVDDIRIFAKSIPEARRLLGDLIIKLRKMGLFVSSAKTKISESQEVVKNLVTRREVLSSIDKRLKSKDIEEIGSAANKICELFNIIISDEKEFDDRLFRYCVNRFKKFAATDICETIHLIAIPEVLKRFEKMPNSTDIFVDYLSMFPDNLEIQNSIIDFLLSDYNIYPWQEMQFLELLIRENVTEKNFKRILPFVKKLAINSHGRPSARKATIFLGKNGSYADRREIRDLFTQKNDVDDQRSILFAIQEMQTSERNHFYKNVSNSPAIRYTVDFIKDLNETSYHFYKPPVGYEIFYDDTIDDDSDDLRDMGSEYFL